MDIDNDIKREFIVIINSKISKYKSGNPKLKKFLIFFLYINSKEINKKIIER